MIYFGIDIGVTGAIALMEDEKLEWVKDVPSFEVHVSGKKRTRYNARGCWDLLHPWVQEGGTKAILEDISGHGGIGSRALLQMGTGSGLWQGIVAGQNIPVEIARPTDWKREMLRGLDWKGKGAKEAARSRACQLFPDCASLFSRKKDHNRAEAALMAEYLRRMYQGEMEKEESA